MKYHPDLKLGTILNLTIHDGDKTIEKSVKIIAFDEYSSGFAHYADLFMAKEAMDRFSSYNPDCYFTILAKKEYDPQVEAKIKNVIKDNESLKMGSWKEEYDTWRKSMAIVSNACFVFFIGAGSLIGYYVFLREKKNGLFSIEYYHYPVKVVCIIAVILFLLQMFLAVIFSHTAKKESVIERIRFSE